MIKELSNFTNRSVRQTEFLYEVCQNDIYTLILLEYYLYNNSKFHCFVPKNMKDVYTVLTSKPKSYRISIKDFFNKVRNTMA